MKETPDERKRYLLDGIKTSRGLIRYADKAMEKSKRPEFWQGVMTHEQERIAEYMEQLTELSLAAKV